MKRALFAAGLVACAVLFPLSLHYVFFRAALQTGGNPPLYFNQKIFYWHVPNATLLFAGVIVSGVASALYLRRRAARLDDWAQAGADLAVLFGLVMLVTGSLWAKPAWGHWWVWDARLTSSLILWLTMLGYALTRRYGGAGSERLAAGLAIFATINIPLVYLSTTIWRTFHPPKDVVPGLEGDMARAFLLSWLVFAVFFILVLVVRHGLIRSERALSEARERALDAGLIE
jgi:heme exporter protein C